MSAYLSPSPFLQFFNLDGSLASGGLLFTYISNTTTKANTFTDGSGAIPNTNPIVLDSYGSCNCWLPPGALFTYVLSPSTDSDPPTNPIRTVNNVSAGGAIATVNYANDSGVANQAVASVSGISSLFQGLAITLSMAATNTSAATLNINGLGAKPIVLQTGAPLSGGELLLGGEYLLQYTGTVWQILGLPITYSKTDAERIAGVTPLKYSYPELNALRYADPTSPDCTAALQSAISVLAQKFNGEMLIPSGSTFHTGLLSISGISDFRIRCDGVLQSNAASLGSFIDLHTQAGTYTPLKISTCTRFKIYGEGYINPGFVDALNITSCSDFDLDLDCRGSGQNSVMRGILIQECFRFRVHGMTIDSITGNNAQGALTTTAVVNSGATTATASAWPGGPGTFTVVFTEVSGGAFETRSVIFSGTGNTTMTWSGGLSANCTATFYAEIYYDWLAGLTIFSCYEYKIDHNFIKGHGGNGIYVLSVGDGVVNYCHDFDICDNLIEFNAESGIQLTYGGGTVCPVNYRVNNNTLKNNQADGIDAANTGPFANVFAQFNNNSHTNNGFINFNPANPGGADGSGIGTFSNIGEFEAVGNVVDNCNNAGIYLSGCIQWRIANCVIGKIGNSSSQGGVYISGSFAGSLRDCDVSVPSVLPSLSILGNGNSIIIDGCNLNGGAVSLSNGTYTGSKISRCLITGVGSINVVMDMIDNNILLTGTAPVGLVCSAPNLKLIRNTINAAGPAINTNSQRHVVIDGNITTVTGAQTGVLVNGSNGCVVTNNNSTSTSSPAFQLSGSCDHTVVSGNEASSASGNSYSYGASTLTSAFGNASLVGSVSLGTATFQVNFPL